MENIKRAHYRAENGVDAVMRDRHSICMWRDILDKKQVSVFSCSLSVTLTRQCNAHALRVHSDQKNCHFNRATLATTEMAFLSFVTVHDVNDGIDENALSSVASHHTHKPCFIDNRTYLYKYAFGFGHCYRMECHIHFDLYICYSMYTTNTPIIITIRDWTFLPPC